MSYIPSELKLTESATNTTSTIEQNINGNLIITNPANFGNIDFDLPNGFGKVRFNKSVNFSTYADFQGDLTLYANQAFQNNGREIFIDNNTNTYTEFKQDTAGVFQFSNNNGVVINSSTGLKLQSLANANNYQLPTPDTLPLQNQIITFNSNGTSQFVNQSAPLTSSIFNYRASTPSYGVPASGFIEWALPFQITPLLTEIRVSHLNQDGQDIDTLLSLLQINDTILIQDKNNSDNYQKWIIQNTPVVVPNSYIEFSVGQMTGGYQFSNNHSIVLITSTGSSILALQNQVQTNTFDISVLQTDVATNTADIITNAGAISILQLQQITDSGNISTLQGQQITNASNITTLQGQQITNASNISTLQGQQITNASNITTLQQKITTIYNIVGLSGVGAGSQNVFTNGSALNLSLLASSVYSLEYLIFYNTTQLGGGIGFTFTTAAATPFDFNFDIQFGTLTGNTTNFNIRAFNGAITGPATTATALTTLVVRIKGLISTGIAETVQLNCNRAVGAGSINILSANCIMTRLN
jgi:hypothetical protein